jgi:hypothetical protein
LGDGQDAPILRTDAQLLDRLKRAYDLLYKARKIQISMELDATLAAIAINTRGKVLSLVGTTLLEGADKLAGYTKNPLLRAFTTGSRIADVIIRYLKGYYPDTKEVSGGVQAAADILDILLDRVLDLVSGKIEAIKAALESSVKAPPEAIDEAAEAIAGTIVDAIKSLIPSGEDEK